MLKGSLVAPDCQCHWKKCALHKNFAYYAGIMLDAFAILLCSKLCWHNWLKLNIELYTLLYMKQPGMHGLQLRGKTQNSCSNTGSTLDPQVGTYIMYHGL